MDFVVLVEVSRVEDHTTGADFIDCLFSVEVEVLTCSWRTVDVVVTAEREAEKDRLWRRREGL